MTRKAATWWLDGNGNHLDTGEPFDWDLVQDGDSLEVQGRRLDVSGLDRQLTLDSVTIHEAPSVLVYGPLELILQNRATKVEVESE